MNHDTAASLLADLVFGRLNADDAGPLHRHLAECASCRDILSTMHQVRGAYLADRAATEAPARRGGDAAHPAALDLVGYALGDASLSIPATARVGLHVSACATCAEDVRVARQMNAAALHPSWMNRLRALWADGGPRWNVLMPALAALAIVLSYPGYLGLRELPLVRRENQELTGEVARLRAERTRPPVQETGDATSPLWSGGAPLVVLTGARRGDEESPRVAVDDTRPYAVFGIDLGSRSLPDSIGVRIAAAPNGRVAWEGRFASDRVWDRANHLAVLVVPTHDLATGTHRLTVRGLDDRELFASTFVVAR